MSDDQDTVEGVPEEMVREVNFRENLAIRGRKRLACVKNAIAWSIFGTEDEEEITITEGEGIACERAAIRSLAQMRDAGLIDNEPLLGLATTRELLEELEARGRVGMAVPRLEEERKLEVFIQTLKEKLPEEVLDYTTKSPKDVADDFITETNNSVDTDEKEDTAP